MTARSDRARLGYEGYVRLLSLLRETPANTSELVNRSGAGKNSICRLIAQFHYHGLVHICRFERSEGGYTRPIYAYGAGVDAVPPAFLPSGEPCQPRIPKLRALSSEVVSFAALLEELSEPTSVPELIESTGLSRNSLRNALRILRSADMARIAGWQPRPTLQGQRMALWQLGRAPDKPYPNRQQTKRDARKRRREVSQGRATISFVSAALAGVAPIAGPRSVFEVAR